LNLARSVEHQPGLELASVFLRDKAAKEVAATFVEELGHLLGTDTLLEDRPCASEVAAACGRETLFADKGQGLPEDARAAPGARPDGFEFLKVDR
jgi:hypothetical protein